MEQDANRLSPDSGASPLLGPEVSSMRRSVCFLKADDICLTVGAKKVVKFLPLAKVAQATAVDSANR
jgi:hypothetical protein